MKFTNFIYSFFYLDLKVYASRQKIMPVLNYAIKEERINFAGSVRAVLNFYYA